MTEYKETSSHLIYHKAIQKTIADFDVISKFIISPLQSPISLCMFFPNWCTVKQYSNGIYSASL